MCGSKVEKCWKLGNVAYKVCAWLNRKLRGGGYIFISGIDLRWIHLDMFNRLAVAALCKLIKIPE